jgi:hypothetical protein
MSDIFDDASEVEQLQREIAIKQIRNKKKQPFTGHCLCCNEEILEGRFCSTECREDWELEQKLKSITGF